MCDWGGPTAGTRPLWAPLSHSAREALGLLGSAVFSTQDPLASRSINGSSPVQGRVLSPGVPSPSPGFGAVPQSKEKPRGMGKSWLWGWPRAGSSPNPAVLCPLGLGRGFKRL